MSKTARLALIIALLLPIASYFFVKGKSENAIAMPLRYFPDSLDTKTVDGKLVTDTFWRKTAKFNLTNQLGQQVSGNDLDGKIIVADFFFTHCPSICPLMTINMKRLQESIHNGQRVGDRTNYNVHFLSFSVDPERDSIERLKYWADRFQVNPDQWWLLTGDKKQIYDMALEQFSLATIDGQGVDTSFIHSDKFVLIDANRIVRGYYSGLDSTSLAQLSRDIVMLTMEKDPRKKSIFDGKLTTLAIIFLLTLVGVGVALTILNKNKKQTA